MTVIDLSLFALSALVLARVPLRARLIGVLVVLASASLLWLLVLPPETVALRIVLFGTALWCATMMLADAGHALRPVVESTESSTHTGEDAELTVLATGDAPHYPDQHLITITSAWHLSDVWNELHRGVAPRPAVPAVDLEQHRIIVACGGQQIHPSIVQVRRLLVRAHDVVAESVVVPDSEHGTRCPFQVVLVPAHVRNVEAVWHCQGSES
jgi:hypothetical protein